MQQNPCILLQVFLDGSQTNPGGMIGSGFRFVSLGSDLSILNECLRKAFSHERVVLRTSVLQRRCLPTGSPTSTSDPSSATCNLFQARINNLAGFDYVSI